MIQQRCVFYVSLRYSGFFPFKSSLNLTPLNFIWVLKTSQLRKLLTLSSSGNSLPQRTTLLHMTETWLAIYLHCFSWILEDSWMTPLFSCDKVELWPVPFGLNMLIMPGTPSNFPCFVSWMISSVLWPLKTSHRGKRFLVHNRTKRCVCVCVCVCVCMYVCVSVYLYESLS